VIRVLNKASACATLRVAALTITTFVLGITAAAATGQPEPWQLNLQPAATGLHQQNIDFHNLLLVIITAITLFVMALMLWVIVRYNRKANPTPSTTSHNTLLEIVWTLVPVLILVFIAIPSYKLLYAHDRTPPVDLTVKAIGNQWYWTYEYPDQEGLAFDSIMLTDEEAAAQGKPRTLATDTHVVVPVGKVVRVLVTASDVIHAWTIPAFGVKVDAIPGRTNEVWFKADREGLYYGQCSELCGIKHAFMPIVVEVVSEERFAQWLEEAKEQYGSVSAPISVAAVAQ
jgi:cytochrome c oxidase subunit 2